MNMQTFEDRVKQEYGAVSAFIALHPKLCTMLALFIGASAGHFL